jgi:hypothetical protein
MEFLDLPEVSWTETLAASGMVYFASPFLLHGTSRRTLKFPWREFLAAFECVYRTLPHLHGKSKSAMDRAPPASDYSRGRDCQKCRRPWLHLSLLNPLRCM